jgi:hypothetical protein
MAAPLMPNFETIAQITLGWSISMSHPSNLRLAAKHLNLMAQDLAITAKPNIVDIEALRTLLCGLCVKICESNCEYAGNSTASDRCPLLTCR